MIDIRCKCGKHLKVPASAVGRAGRCPFCEGKLWLIAPRFSPGRDRFEGLLEVTAGPLHVGEQFLLSGSEPIEIGKLPDKHIMLPDKKVSRSHCRLLRAGSSWRIEDQQSTNGVFVNSRRISQHDLGDGDVIRIGDFEMRYHSLGLKPLAPAVAVKLEATAPAERSEELLEDDLALLAEGETIKVSEPVAVGPAEMAPERAAPTGGPICPSCQRSLAPQAKICVACGIDLRTGRAILTAHGADLDTLYVRAESVIRWISWIIWAGIYPIASEAFGTRKPYVIRGVAVATVLASVWFWTYEWSDSPKMQTMKNYLLWCGQAQPKPEQVLRAYAFTNYGDRDTFEAKLDDLAEKRGPEASDMPKGENPVLLAHRSLAPEQQCFGRYAPSQLLTNVFLHAGLLHLAGNMIFLLVIGSRVNALIGNLASAVLYPLLGIVASIAYMISAQHHSPHPALGASGAIMGLAGMYLVLMPVHKMHVACWWRLGLFWGFRLVLKLFAVRGFWVLLFFIAFDVLHTVLRVQGNVAHWAHLGGFLGGMAVGLLLLLTRAVNCRGGDILSALLGKYAWALIGKPDNQRKAILEHVW